MLTRLFLLVYANGYIRVLELKRPFKDRIISKSQYRYNHYALKELNGSIMQVEKYLYHLTRNSLFKCQVKNGQKCAVKIPQL